MLKLNVCSETIKWHDYSIHKPLPEWDKNAKFLVQHENGVIQNAFWRQNDFISVGINRTLTDIVTWAEYKGVDENLLKVNRITNLIENQVYRFSIGLICSSEFLDEVIQIIENELLKEKK